MALIFYTIIAIGILLLVVAAAVVILITLAKGRDEDTKMPICILTGETCKYMDEDCRDCTIAEEERKIGDR